MDLNLSVAGVMCLTSAGILFFMIPFGIIAAKIINWAMDMFERFK